MVSSDAVGKLPLKLIAPITDWKDWYANNLWHVKLSPTTANGLTKECAVDVLQVRGVDTQRFVEKLGRLSATEMEEIAAAIAGVVEYE